MSSIVQKYFMAAAIIGLQKELQSDYIFKGPDNFSMLVLVCTVSQQLEVCVELQSFCTEPLRCEGPQQGSSSRSCGETLLEKAE